MDKRRKYLLSIAGTLAMVFSVASMARAQDNYPHGGALDARQHGYEHGYRDGFQRGSDSRAHNGSSDFHTEDYERGDRGYESYMGERSDFRSGYRDGFSAGYQDGFNGNRGRFGEIYGGRNRDFDSDRDRGDRDRSDTVYSERRWSYRDVAGDIGYRDGLVAGAKDAREGHSFRPQEHDSWKDGDHGYVGSFGNKNDYKRTYRESYEAGYAAAYGGRR
jgi:hypothetical protein